MLRGGARCYCGGVGTDISFDLALSKRYGCEVWAFDPVPAAAKHVAHEARDVDGLHFLPVGLWSSDGTLRLHPPSEPGHVSYSVSPTREGGQPLDAPVRSVPSLMAQFGHERLDLLKLDIEGSEWAVVPNLFDSGVEVDVICVEIHLQQGLRAARQLLGALAGAGYRTAHVEGLDFTFVRGWNAPPTGT